jgi:periplasmic protein TonB
MFEDSTFESMGTIHTRSRNWMVATSGLNGSVLLALVFIPLLYPHALPRMMLPFLVEAPVAPVVEVKPVTRVEPVKLVTTEMQGNHVFAPTTIPRTPYIAETPEALPSINVANMPLDDGSATNTNLFNNQSQRPVVRQQTVGAVRVSGLVVEGLLIQRTIPRYPPIAIATRMQGTVVLQATISRAGTIENLHVMSGPQMLQQAAMDAVRNWRYRPYLLSGEPVEVETTVNVVFKLQD